MYVRSGAGVFTRAILVSASAALVATVYLLVQKGAFHYRMHVALIGVFTQEGLYCKNPSCLLSFYLSLLCVCRGAFSIVKRCVQKQTGMAFAAKIINKKRLSQRGVHM